MDPLNPHCGTHVPWVNTKKQLWHKSSSVCTVWTPVAQSKAVCTTVKGWLGSRCTGNSVWSLPSIRETEKGTFNPVGSLRRHRQRRCAHSLNSSMSTGGEKRGRREGANGEEGGGGCEGEYRERERDWADDKKNRVADVKRWGKQMRGEVLLPNMTDSAVMSISHCGAVRNAQ